MRKSPPGPQRSARPGQSERPKMEIARTQADAFDWSIHAEPQLWPISSKLFLAQAVNQTGAALWDLWSDDLPGWLAHPIVPRIPWADEAFDADEPNPAIHAQLGPHIR